MRKPLYKLFHQLGREYMRSESPAAARELFSFIDQMERSEKQKDDYLIMIAEAYELLGYFGKAYETLQRVKSQNRLVREKAERARLSYEKWGGQMEVPRPKPELIKKNPPEQEGTQA